MKEADWAIEERNAAALDPDEAGDQGFVAFLKCAVPQCGQIVSIHGDARLQRSRYEEFGEQFEWILFPKGMHPAPPLATIPAETPDIVADQLRRSFHLFWLDAGSCANRLRISVERILDEFLVPPGTLNTRIQKFKTADPDHAETFDALRFVGNVGSHEGAVSRETILDAFEIYQDALAELFGKRKARMVALKRKIIASKGK